MLMGQYSKYFNSPSPSNGTPKHTRSVTSHNASISNIDEIEVIKKKNKLALGKERMEKIKYSLSIE